MPTQNPPSLLEYSAMLAQHDWLYSFSDDHRVWLSGKNKESELKHLSLSTPEHLELYNLYCSFIRNLVTAPPEESNNIRAKFLVEKDNFLKLHAKRPTSPQ